MVRILEAIQHSLELLIKHDVFRQWLTLQRTNSGDLIVFNDSFTYRDVRTTKSDIHLAIEVDDTNDWLNKISVITGLKINSDFKLIPKGKLSDQNRIELTNSVHQQQTQLGQLIYMLIGAIDDSVVIQEPIANEVFNTVKWDPSLNSTCHIDQDVLIVSDIYDEEQLWNHIIRHYQAIDQRIPDGLKEKFGEVLDRLQGNAVANLHMPTEAPIGPTITEKIIEVLRNQQGQYQEALEKLPDPAALNEILRIAYNFASDATGYLKLIVSICDLKPLVLWGTIGQHFELSEYFRQMPWARSKNKPSLKNYRETISDARNSAFHNLFPFRKSLSIQLSDSALKNPELRIFSEHSKKKENQLTYQDKELVDILADFTRGRERRVTERFWRHNVTVMDGTINLFQATNDFLQLLHSERKDA